MKRINFNKGWEFCLNDGKDWDARFESEYIVDLPYDFSIIQDRCADAPSGASGGFFRCGVGKYRKTFKAKRGKKYLFMCDGAFGVTDVLVNSSLALTNKYGYNSFYVDMTDYLRYDKENEILVTVNNQAQPNARWYSGSGIYRDVFLCESDSYYIHPFGLFVQTESVFDKCAYLNAQISIVAPKRAQGVVDFEVFEDKKRTSVAKFSKHIALEAGENNIVAKFQIDGAKLWDIDTPSLYRIKATSRIDGTTDTDESIFGIRIVNVDSNKGFMLNGKSIKLRGGCIHHDQGILGSAVYPETEYRRVAKLKEAGFNAIRLSHNPQSPYLYEACDRLGMLVMDELFDYWTQGKKQNDFHSYFKDSFESWTELIVRRNRCHPSIVMWSTGNEIPQKAGRGDGYYIATEIANKIRSLDTSRPITHALCSLWDNAEEYEREKAENDFPASELDYFARATAITADTADIVGYNYLEYRLEKDLERFPSRLIINTETFPLCAYTTIKQLLKNPRIVGDFVWTAWDYFGETAIGHVEYNERRGDFSLPHPYHISNCGDIDILGVRKPQSYYREIAWGIRKAPYIAVRHPSLTDTPYFISGWGFYECEHSWCYEGYEGKGVEVYVFSDCDELILELNGKEIARLPRTENGVYRIQTAYEPGILVAKAVINGKIEASSCLKTENKPSKIALVRERSPLANGAKAPDTEIVYVDVEIQDENGEICTQDSRFVKYEAQNAQIMGCANGDLTYDGKYTASELCVNRGRALVVLKKQRGEGATLTATADGLDSVTINL